MLHRHVNIFLSSTFRDMQAERDYVRKRVVPRLQEALAGFGITVKVTDLRWGIDTTGELDESREAKVLRVCMDAIQNDRPYFVGLLGGRYGWIPPEDQVSRLVDSLPEETRTYLDRQGDRSVTEMEILYGALADPAILPHSFFFMRNEKVYDSIPDEYRCQYIEDDEYRAGRLLALKQNIISVCCDNNEHDNVHVYDAKWDGQENQLSGLEDFGDALYKALYSDILKYNEDVLNISEVDYEERMLDSFVIRNLYGFRGRDKILTRLKTFLNGFDPLKISGTNGCFISGFSGCGKSSVFCKLLSEMKSQHQKNLVVLAHSAGLTEKSCSPKDMLVKWSKQMRNLLEDKDEPLEDVVQDFNNLMVKAISRGLKPVVLIDSYDSFDFIRGIYRPEQYRDLFFIPKNVPFVCTVLPGYVEEIVRDTPSYELIEMDDFSDTEARDLVYFILKENVRELSAGLIGSLLAKKRSDGRPSYSSPLWLRLALSILDEIGDKDFRAINQEKFDRDDFKIAAYLEKLIDGFAPEPEELFMQFIDLSCQYFPEKLVKTSVIFSSVSHSGISENDISEICPDVWDELDFTSLAHWLRQFFRKDPLTGRWAMSHNVLKSVLNSYDREFTEKLRLDYIDILFKRKDTESFRELCYQVIVGNDVDSFADLCDFYYSASSENWICLINGLLARNLGRKEFKTFIGNVVRAYHDNEDIFRYFIIDMMCDSTNDLVDGESFKLELLEYAVSSFPKQELAGACSFSNYLLLVEKIIVIHSWVNEYDEVDRYCLSLMETYHEYVGELGKGVLREYMQGGLFNVMAEYKAVPLSMRNQYLSDDDRWRSLRAEVLKRHMLAVEEIRYFISLDGSYVSQQKDNIKYLWSRALKNWGFTDDQLDELRASAAELHVDENVVHDVLDIGYTSGDIDFSQYLNDRNDDIEEESMINAGKAPEEISRFISSNIKNRYDDDYIGLVKLYASVAGVMVAEGHSCEAFEQMKVCKGLYMNHLSQLPMLRYRQSSHGGRYLLNKNDVAPLEIIVEWMAANGHIESAVEFIEEVYSVIRLWVALNPADEDLMTIVNMVINCHVNMGNIEKAKFYMRDLVEFIFRYPVPKIDFRRCRAVQDYMDLLQRLGDCEALSRLEEMKKNWPLAGCDDVEDVYNYKIMRRFNSGLCAVAVPGRHSYDLLWGFADAHGTKIIEPQFDAVSCFSGGFAMAGLGNREKSPVFGGVGMKYGFIDESGKVKIAMKYDYASSFYDGKALVFAENHFFYIDINDNFAGDL